ncbi:TrmH family RNA methyltransferase [Alteromonas genovensis]|uniref:TrmH family RNA methyltransferase n=1 Tax=Alteromonas genovensis TaxID=471225 RepID=UPI002FDFF05B
MKLSDVKKLHQKKYRTQFGYYLVEGEHLILELLKSTPKNTVTVYVTSEYEAWLDSARADYAPLRSDDVIQVQTVTSVQMQQISDTKSPQGIIARVPLPSVLNSELNSVTRSLSEEAPRQNANADEQMQKSVSSANSKRCIYLYEVQDPGNLGTILRTLAWFGQFKLLLSPNSVDPFNSKVVRSSMGAIFHADMELNVPLESLTSRFSQFAYLDMHGQEVKSESFAHFECYLFGNEARGVPTEDVKRLNATAFTIPGSGKIDSLNLASAVNICAYELSC